MTRETAESAGGATGDQCHAESGDDGGIGPISPCDPPTGFHVKREPRKVGGERYWKCQYCGVESIWWSERDMTSERVHKDFCGHPDVGPEVMTDGGVEIERGDFVRVEGQPDRKQPYRVIAGPALMAGNGAKLEDQYGFPLWLQSDSLDRLTIVGEDDEEQEPWAGSNNLPSVRLGEQGQFVGQGWADQ